MSDNQLLRIVIASNSQGTSSGISLECNYPSVLQNRLGRKFQIHRILISGWTSRDFFNNFYDNVISVSPDLVLMHFGIVESAQRILSNHEKFFFSLLPFGSGITSFLHRNRSPVLKLRKSLGLQARQVSFVDYADSVHNIASELNRYKIRYLFLRTPFFPDNGESVGHPFINQDIEAYNHALDEYKSIALDLCSGGWTMEDYQPGTVHFSESGHRKIADLLTYEVLIRLCPEKLSHHNFIKS